jgi:hypothetical protein
MASPDHVKQYIAYWFQLGKHLVLSQGELVLPPVFEGDHYSPAFEACWQQVLEKGGQNCYLEGTIQTIADLLSSQWDISSCARCSMPVPMVHLGIHSAPCPCFDLPTWPNPDLPQPRSPVDSRNQLQQIRDRLSQK